MSRTEIRGLLSSLSGWFYEKQHLQTVQKLLQADKEAVLAEIEKYFQFIDLYQAPGKLDCKFCQGKGFGTDGRGDPWTCMDCKPQLKSFWNE